MKLIPVIDLLNGRTVRAVAGQRDQYAPVLSLLKDSVDPSVLLPEMARVCRTDLAYVADLDAILRQQPNRCLLAELTQLPLTIMVDAGVRTDKAVQDLLDLGVDQVVLGLESLPGPDVLKGLLQHFGPDALTLSFDLKRGQPLTCCPEWQTLPAHELLSQLLDCGIQRWIILDLAGIGTGQGVTTLDLCRQLRRQRPTDHIITGGGIRTIDDLRHLSEHHIDGALIASALHQGTISADDIATLV